jgi:hypothetical protein
LNISSSVKSSSGLNANLSGGMNASSSISPSDKSKVGVSSSEIRCLIQLPKN